MLDRRLALGTVKDVSFSVDLQINSEGELNIPIAPFGYPHLRMWRRHSDESDEWFLLDLSDEVNLPKTDADVLAIFECRKHTL